MKKFISIIAILITLLCLVACGGETAGSSETTGNTSEEEQFTIVEHKDDNGNITKTETFDKDGTLIGYVTYEYHANGKMKLQEQYERGVIISHVEYNENEDVTRQNSYENGKIHSYTINTYYDSGKIHTYSFYQKDRLRIYNEYIENCAYQTDSLGNKTPIPIKGETYSYDEEGNITSSVLSENYENGNEKRTERRNSAGKPYRITEYRENGTLLRETKYSYENNDESVLLQYTVSEYYESEPPQEDKEQDKKPDNEEEAVSPVKKSELTYDANDNLIGKELYNENGILTYKENLSFDHTHPNQTFRRRDVYRTIKEYYETGEIKKELCYNIQKELIRQEQFLADGTTTYEYSLQFNDNDELERIHMFKIEADGSHVEQEFDGNNMLLRKETKTFFASGEEKSEEIYDYSEEDGTIRHYHFTEFYENGKDKKVSAIDYEFGVKQRVSTEEFDENGQQKSKLHEDYRDGVLYDKTLWEFEDGLVVKSELERPNTGELFVTFHDYYASKNLKSEKLYTNGKLTNHNEYYDSEKATVKYHFSYNTPYQTEESFYSETEVLLKREYTDYNEKGIVIRKQKTECYDSGVVKFEEQKFYSEEGKLVNHEIFEYYENGNRKHEESYSYDENGQLRTSTVREYYENGQVKKHIRTDYKNGIKFHDTVHEYDENGNITNK